MKRTTMIAAAGLLAAAACKKADTPAYANDGDTGAAAPATQITPDKAPDSTTGVAHTTGSASPAGDTLGAQGKAAMPSTTPHDTAKQGVPTTKRP